MPTEEKNYDRAVWVIHTLLYEVKSMNERMEQLDELSRLPVYVVVEIAQRDGFNFHELIDFIQEGIGRPRPQDGNVIPLRRGMKSQIY